jgi:hypothetical protein
MSTKRIFRLTFNVEGEDRLGVVMGLIAGEVSNIDLHEIVDGPAKPKRRQEDWVKKFETAIVGILADGQQDYHQIGSKLVAAGLLRKPSGASSILSLMVKSGKIERVGRGMYRISPPTLRVI